MPKVKHRGRPKGTSALSVTVAYLKANFSDEALVPVSNKFMKLHNLTGRAVKSIDVIKGVVAEQKAAAQAEAARAAALVPVTAVEAAPAETASTLNIVAGD